MFGVVTVNFISFNYFVYCTPTDTLKLKIVLKCYFGESKS